MTLTYKVTLDRYIVELYLFDIRDPKNLRNKKKIIALASLEPEIRKVTLRVTWPWRTGSRLIGYSVELYLFDIRDPKNLRNKKKDHRSSVTRTRDKKDHAQGHVTLTHRVTLEGYSVDFCPFEFYKQNYIQNSSKIISVAHPGLEIGTVMWKLLWKSAWPWISRSRFNGNASKLWFLKASAFYT